MTTVIKPQDRFDESVTASVLAKATAQGRQRRHPGLHALSVAYLPAYRSLLIGFSDGGFKYEVQHGLTRRETPRGVS